MKFNKQFFIVICLALTFVASTGFAQQDGKTLLQECLKAQEEEFAPLAQEQDSVYQNFLNRSSSIRNILRWLEEDYKTADARRIKEIETLEAHLKALKANADMTSPAAVKNLAATKESANVMLEDIDEERDDAIKPFSRKLSALQRKYKPQETLLEPVMLELFREKGNSVPTADLIRSYGSFAYSTGTVAATYKRDGDNRSAAICYIYLVNDKVGKQKYGKFLNKFPIAYRSQNQLEVLIGQTRVTLYSSDQKLHDQQLDATLASLLDIAKFEALLAK